MYGRTRGTDARSLVDAIAVGGVRRTAKKAAKSRVRDSGRSKPNKRGHLVRQNVGPGAAAIIGTIDALLRPLFDELRTDQDQVGIRGIDRNVADVRPTEVKEAEAWAEF